MISTPLPFTYDDMPAEAWLHVTALYRPAAPYQIDLHFADDNLWSLSRQMLAQAFERFVDGGGDIVMWPSRADRIAVRITGVDGQVVLLFDRARLADFLAGTYRLVPPGFERLDIDAAIARILEETPC